MRSIFVYRHHHQKHYIIGSPLKQETKDDAHDCNRNAPAAPRLTLFTTPLLDLFVEVVVAAELVAVVVPFCCLAAASNAAKLLGPDSTEFTLKTIPEPQWLAYTRIDQSL